MSRSAGGKGRRKLPRELRTARAAHTGAAFGGLEVLEPRLFCSADNVPYGAGERDTSEFMIGRVAVTAVLLESDGSVDRQSEDWSATEVDTVKQQISTGLRWWQDTFDRIHPNSPHDLEFVVDWSYADQPVKTGYEPVRRQHSDEEMWISDFLAHAGSDTPAHYKVDVARFNHEQRQSLNTHWAFTVFVVDSSSDTNGRFADNYFAYAYHGGPLLVMTYDNGPWGIERMGQVLAHETVHIFYALNEFAGSDSYWKHSGYYNTQNRNSARNHPAPESRTISLFAEDPLQNEAYTQHASSPSSFEMIGWRDFDGDGILDVLDMPLSLTGSRAYEHDSGFYRFRGASKVNVLPNKNPLGRARDITLNKVDALQYRIDEGEWIDAGSYGAYETPVVLDLAVNDPGRHTVDVRTIDRDSSVTSNVYSDTFLVTAATGARLSRT